MADKVREAGCPDGYGDRHAAKCENAVVAARVIEGAWGDGYIAGRRAALDAPLAAPSGGCAEKPKGTRCWDLDLCCGDDLCKFQNGEPLPRGVYCAKDAAPSGGDATPRDEAVALLADARKCVVLANANGYYDVWLSRCDRVLGGAR